MQKKCYFVSTEAEQRNTQLYESNLKLSFNIGDFKATLESTLYNYGVTIRPEEEQCRHVASLFSRFWFFEENGAIIRYEDDGSQFFLSSGQLHIITPGHPFRITYMAGSVLYYAHFSVLDWTGQSLFRHAPRVLKNESAMLDVPLRSTWAARCSGGTLSFLIHIVVCYLFRDWEKVRNEYELCAKFKPVFELMCRVPPAQLRVGDLAETMNMTQAAFSRCFCGAMRIPPKDYLTKYYFERACELLCFSGSSIAETARILGHNDIHNFFHTFKRIAGVSPADYRSKRRKNF